VIQDSFRYEGFGGGRNEFGIGGCDEPNAIVIAPKRLCCVIGDDDIDAFTIQFVARKLHEFVVVGGFDGKTDEHWRRIDALLADFGE